MDGSYCIKCYQCATSISGTINEHSSSNDVLLEQVKQRFNSMYQLQILFQKQGDWENTVYHPMTLMRALNVMATKNRLYSTIHCYRIVEC